MSKRETYPLEIQVLGAKNYTNQDSLNKVLFSMVTELNVDHRWGMSSWEFRNYLWDLLPSAVEDVYFKDHPMSFYLATFRLRWTVKPTSDFESELDKEQMDNLTKTFCGDLNHDVMVGASEVLEGPRSLYPRCGRVLRREMRGRVAEIHELQESFNGKLETKVTVTIGLFYEEKYVWPTFRTPFDPRRYTYGILPMKTLREQEMTRFSASIRRKSFWYNKINNAEILAKWKLEAKAQGLSENQVSYVLKELDYYASLIDPVTGIQVSDVDGVWYSDTSIDESLRKELISRVAILETVPDFKKDWHPGSNNQVLDLVHPSLYPIAYGYTRAVKENEGFVREEALDYCGAGELVERLSPERSQQQCYGVDEDTIDDDYTTSEKYCWLPTEFIVRNDGTVRIDSYINNLHPIHHASLYDTLEKIFAKFVPLFENVLSDQIFRLNRECLRIKPEPYRWYGPGDHYEDDHPVIVPDAPQHFVQPDPIPLAKKISLLGTRLQVIVKLANIVLPPGSQGYPGGVWHVEGMKNENIVASGIYYYEVCNITESQLAFRCSVAEPSYEQDDRRGVEAVYGFHDDDILNEQLGSVLTQQGRSVAFPNAFQHCVQPFQLEDASKEGYRKILVFLLVDPGTKILSTSTVPPQQFDWFKEELIKIPPFDSLLPEITDHILQFVEWPTTFAKAKNMREELMQERKFVITNNNEQNFERPFSLCEH